MKNYSFYIPNRIELLFDFFGDLDIKLNNPYTNKEKEKVLEWVRKLLKNKILCAGEYNKEKKFIKWNLSTNEIIQKIKDEWVEDIEFPQFYDLVWFNYQKWYIKKLKCLGYNDEVNWEEFLKNNICNLEKWIEDNKPK